MNHRPRKRFGQHFLHDPGVIARIVAAVDPRPGQNLVEIGPGRGALTRALLERNPELQVVELDRDLAAALAETLGHPPGLTIHQADALAFDFSALAGDGRLRVTGNLPYNISTPLLFHLFDQADVIVDMHFMLQREVVDRLVAAPGGKTYGRLSVMAQARCKMTSLIHVGPGAFNPPPKVDSALIRLLPHALSSDQARLLEPLSRVVRAAFGQRRKTLRNSLKGLLDQTAIEQLGIDPGARAETLDLEAYWRLAGVVGR